MGVIKGQNLRITIGGKYIAFATTCTIHLAAQLEESSSKDSTNGFKEQSITGMSWDISADALYSVDTDATGVNGVDALDLILAQQRVLVEFVQTTGAKNREDVGGSVTYSGYAWVNDISVSAPNRANTTFSIQATGDGQLTKGSAASSGNV